MFKGQSRTADKFVVRLPDGMREQIADLAKTNHRSMNSEVIIRMKESLAADDKQAVSIDRSQLSKDETEIVLAVRDLSSERRKALLALLSSDK